MTKERLRNYTNLRRETAQIEARLRALEAQITSLRSPGLSGMPGGHGGVSRPTETAALTLVELEGLYEERLAEMAAEQLAVEEAISSLGDSKERQLMRARYLDGLRWEEVCLVVGYSWAQTHRTHACALAKICEKK